MDGTVDLNLLHPPFIVNCTNDTDRRQAVLEELVDTELAYLKDLQVLNKFYLTPLRLSLILEPNDVIAMAANVNKIENLHYEVFAHLLSLIEQHKNNPSHSLSYFFVQYFLKIADLLRLYSTYSRYKDRKE